MGTGRAKFAVIHYKLSGSSLCNVLINIRINFLNDSVITQQSPRDYILSVSQCTNDWSHSVRPHTNHR
jgi:hypothetical protein